MRMDKLTSKFQLALADAQSLAVGRDHQYIEPLHVMAALLDQEPAITLAHSKVFMPMNKRILNYTLSPLGTHSFRYVDVQE